MIDKTKIAKFATHCIVASQFQKASERVLTNQMDLDEDSTAVRAGSLIVGEIGAQMTDTYTDQLVDTVIAKWQSRKTIKDTTK